MTILRTPVFVDRVGSASSDAELLAMAAGRSERRESNEAAMDALVRRYIDFVYAAAMRQLRDHHTAEDVTQAVFLVLARKAGSIRPHALSVWLHQTTRYAAANARRIEQRRRKHERAAARAEIVPPEAVMTPSNQAPEVLLSHLDDAIASLSEKDRLAVVERYLRGCDTIGIASQLNTSPAAVQKRLERALLRLRKRLSISAASTDGLLAAAAPSAAHAAPSSLITAAARRPSTISAAIAQSASRLMLVNKLKMVGIGITALLFAGVAAEMVRRIAATTHTAAPATTLNAPLPKAPPSAITASLRDGVSIQYVGVADNPSADKPWYAPNGELLGRRPYVLAGRDANNGTGTIAREYDFESDAQTASSINDFQPGEATLRFDWQHSIPSDLTPQMMRAMDSQGIQVARQHAVVLRSAAGKPITIRFDIAAGPWTTRIVGKRDADVKIIGQGDISRVLLEPPFEDLGAASVLYWPAGFYSDPDRRLVAIDTAGQIHVPEERDWAYKSPAQRAAEPLLDLVMPALEFNNDPASDVFEKVAAAAKTSVEVDWKALAKIGFRPGIKITSSPGSSRFGFWFPVLMQSVRGESGAVAWTVEKGIIKITPSDWHKPSLIGFYVPNLPLAKLDHFEVQTRPFSEWIEFAGITPELGEPANIVVHTSDDTPAVPAQSVLTGPIQKFTDGTVVELAALGDATAGHCWTPDGTPIAPPFEYQPQVIPATFLHPGKRWIWATTVTHKPDGRFGDWRIQGLDPATGHSAIDSWSSSMPSDQHYQVFTFEIDEHQTMLDWQVQIPSKPPWQATLERDADGWNPAAVARVKLGEFGNAVMWDPEPDANGNLTFRLWSPPTLGSDIVMGMHFTQIDGNGPDGTMFSLADAAGFHSATCQDPPEHVQRATMEFTRYDLRATFHNVAVFPRHS